MLEASPFSRVWKDRRPFLTECRHPILTWASYLLALLIPFSLFWPISSPIIPGVLVHFVTPGLHLTDVALALAIIALAINRRQLDPGPIEIITTLAGLCVLALLTAPWALSPTLALYAFIRWFTAFVVYLCFAQKVVSLERIITIFLAGLCLQTIVGLAQVLANAPLGLPGELAFLNGSDLAWTYRAFGFTFHPNVLGGYLAVGLLLAVPLLSRKLILIGWWLMWLGLLSTFSRSAWLAVAVTMPLVVFYYFRRHPPVRRTLTIALVGLLVVSAVSGFVWQEQMTVRLRPVLLQAQNALQSSTISESPSHPSDPAVPDTKLNRALLSSNTSILERLALAEIALLAIQGNPLQGIGAGNFPAFMEQIELISPPTFVHNVPLLLAAEIGIFGAGLWLLLCLVIAWWLIRNWSAVNGWLIAALCSGVAIAVIALFDYYPWNLNAGRLLTAMVLGLIARTISDRSALDGLESVRIRSKQ